MKLPSPFFRLPLRFDAERLRAEVEALPADAWSRHPQEYQGNTAVRLITVGGADNDRAVGEMRPTPALSACPYVQQVLASFETVWSRSRLMRIEGGGSVPEHSDMNHHWFHRVRVHIPVITRPEVRFHCGDQSVHMAAGEAWIFDNWRRHKVLNPVSDARIHLVADTTGTSAFWRLVSEGQSKDFERRRPESRLVAFDPAARPKLLIERFNATAVMSPAEVEQLTIDLLADLAPVDARPESAAAVDQFVSIVVGFCHDWRSMWALFGDTQGGRPRYEQLINTMRQKVRQLPPVRVASINAGALEVLNARVIMHLFGGSGPTRQETGEFNVAIAAPGESARVQEESGARPRITAAAAPDELPVIERPIIILSAPRAGSTLLFETLAQAAGLYSIGGESHSLIESIDSLRPGRGAVSSNRLTRKDATSAIAAELRRRFASRLRDRDGVPPPSGSRVRLLEKTPKNALRVPFFLEVFPDALFVSLRREPRANLSSMMEAWRAKGWITYRQLPGWPGPWSLLLPPGYERLKGRALEDIVAFQWQAANEAILDDLADIPRERWTTLDYEDLIRDPGTEVDRLLKFAGLAMDPRLAEYLSKPLPKSRHTQTAPDPDKWRKNSVEIERVLPALESVIARLAS